jgi:hypothetical protein
MTEGKSVVQQISLGEARGEGGHLMARCSGITQSGTACKGIPMEGSSYCYVHDPAHAEERRRHGRRGGRRGGRGRPTAELARLKALFEGLANKVLSGAVDRSTAAVVGQRLNGARACVRDGLAAREQEELVGRLEALEEGLEQSRSTRGYGA